MLSHKLINCTLYGSSSLITFIIIIILHISLNLELAFILSYVDPRGGGGEPPPQVDGNLSWLYRSQIRCDLPGALHILPLCTKGERKVMSEM